MCLWPMCFIVYCLWCWLWIFAPSIFYVFSYVAQIVAVAFFLFSSSILFVIHSLLWSAIQSPEAFVNRILFIQDIFDRRENACFYLRFAQCISHGKQRSVEGYFKHRPSSSYNLISLNTSLACTNRIWICKFIFSLSSICSFYFVLLLSLLSMLFN